eukprot:jgi/Chlat1/1046/Chrsp110S01556
MSASSCLALSVQQVRGRDLLLQTREWFPYQYGLAVCRAFAAAIYPSTFSLFASTSSSMELSTASGMLLVACAGQQYRVLYQQVGGVYVLAVGGSGERDCVLHAARALDQAVSVLLTACKGADVTPTKLLKRLAEVYIALDTVLRGGDASCALGPSESSSESGDNWGRQQQQQSQTSSRRSKDEALEVLQGVSFHVSGIVPPSQAPATTTTTLLSSTMAAMPPTPGVDMMVPRTPLATPMPGSGAPYGFPPPTTMGPMPPTTNPFPPSIPTTHARLPPRPPPSPLVGEGVDPFSSFPHRTDAAHPQRSGLSQSSAFAAGRDPFARATTAPLPSPAIPSSSSLFSSTPTTSDPFAANTGPLSAAGTPLPTPAPLVDPSRAASHFFAAPPTPQVLKGADALAAAGVLGSLSALTEAPRTRPPTADLLGDLLGPEPGPASGPGLGLGPTSGLGLRLDSGSGLGGFDFTSGGGGMNINEQSFSNASPAPDSPLSRRRAPPAIQVPASSTAAPPKLWLEETWHVVFVAGRIARAAVMGECRIQPSTANIAVDVDFRLQPPSSGSFKNVALNNALASTSGPGVVHVRLDNADADSSRAVAVLKYQLVPPDCPALLKDSPGIVACMVELSLPNNSLSDVLVILELPFTPAAVQLAPAPSWEAGVWQEGTRTITWRTPTGGALASGSFAYEGLSSLSGVALASAGPNSTFAVGPARCKAGQYTASNM